MGLESLDQELTKRINGLQSELNMFMRQKNSVSIIQSIKSIDRSQTVNNGLLKETNFSIESKDYFLSLLDSNEYLQGIVNSSNFEFQYNVYLLTLEDGIVCVLTFHGSNLSIMAYNPFSSEVKVNVRREGSWPVLKILNSFEQIIFGITVSDEYLKFDGLKLGEVIKPISVEELTNRFLDRLQNQEKQGRKL